MIARRKPPAGLGASGRPLPALAVLAEDFAVLVLKRRVRTARDRVRVLH